MEITDYTSASAYLNHLFEEINDKYFDGKLKVPVITIQSTPRAYGHYTLNDVWSVREKGYREINIGAGGLNRPIENVIATMIHECVHYYCDLMDIQDCSNRGVYHNKRFKEEAERRGLKINKHDKYGWTITTVSGELMEWVKGKGFTDINIVRKDYIEPEGVGGNGGGVSGGDNGTIAGGKDKTKCSTRKYICRYCRISVRATKEVYIICGDCMGRMEVAEGKKLNYGNIK